MLIRFTRLSSDRHRFEIVRDDGTRESHELETRSTLSHDLAHFAVEEPPGWLTPGVISRALERLRRVQGRWRATAFHRTMELEFPTGG